MTFLSLSEPRDLLLMGGAIFTFALSAVCFLCSHYVNAKERMARRVDGVRRTLGVRFSEKKKPTEKNRRLFRLSLAKAHGRDGTELTRRLAPFGLFGRWAGRFDLPVRLGLSIAIGAVLCLVASRLGLIDSPLRILAVFGLGTVAGWYVPAIALDAFARRRLKEIEKALPEAMDLLIIAVEAGLALEDGIDRISAELKRSRPALGRELELTAADLKILPERELALKNLARRVDIPGVHTVTSTLSQTLRYGTPLAQALRVCAGELRNEALSRLEERANRMPVLLTIPMVGFILPAIFILIGGPAFLKVFDVIVR